MKKETVTLSGIPFRLTSRKRHSYRIDQEMWLSDSLSWRDSNFIYANFIRSIQEQFDVSRIGDVRIEPYPGKDLLVERFHVSFVIEVIRQ